VPSIGGNVSSLRDVLPLPAGLADPSYGGRGERTADVMRPGGFDQREAPGFHGCRPPYLPLGSRPDVLVFQTEPLREPTEVTGPIEVHLWVATSAVGTDTQLLRSEGGPRDAALANDGEKGADRQLGMIGHGHGLLHDDVASAPSYFAEAVLLEYLTGLAPGEDAEPTHPRPGTASRRRVPAGVPSSLRDRPSR
jgi:hypothetical protein